MFKVHKDGLRMEPTPERVFSVCQYVSYQSCSRSDLQNIISMFSDSAHNINEITSAIRVAEELSLLQVQDGQVSYSGPKGVLCNYISFRRYVSDRVFQQKDTTFFKVTEWYLSQNETVFNYDTWEDKAAAIVRDGIDGISENDFLGWRFWASFLGEGYLHDRLLIPNMKVRLQDVLATKYKSTFSYEKAIQAYDIIDWLKVQIPEVTLKRDSTLPLAISNALRTLYELKLISLTAQMDATRVKLYPVEGEAFNDFSHIAVKEVIVNELG